MLFSPNIIIPLILFIIMGYFFIKYDVQISEKNKEPQKKTNINTPIEKNDIIMSIEDDYSINDLKQNNVIYDVIDVLKNIPSGLSDAENTKIISTINNYYQSSSNLDEFYRRSEKIKTIPPYDTNYTILIINLFIKFDNKYRKNMKKLNKKKVKFDISPQIPRPTTVDIYNNYASF